MKTALITGGARGLGRATTILMRAKGWHVYSLDAKDPIFSILRTLDNLDALVNCAGVSEGDMMKVNYELTRDLCLEAFKVMKEGGHIVNIGSVAALPEAPLSEGSWPYVVSKCAVHGFTRAFAEDAKLRGIKVNCIAPEGMNTDMYNRCHPNGPPAALEPEDVAKVVLEYCETDVTGQIVPVYAREIQR